MTDASVEKGDTLGETEIKLELEKDICQDSCDVVTDDKSTIGKYSPIYCSICSRTPL